jgi:hypothetical protein
MMVAKGLDPTGRQTFVRVTDGVEGLAHPSRRDLQWNLGLPSAQD